MANDVEHYFMGWFDLCVSSWLKCFLPIFCPFVIRFCCFYYWVWEFLIYSKYLSYIYSFLVAQTVKKICMQCRRFEFDPWGGSLGKRNGYPLPVFLPGEFHGQRSLAGYSPWDHKELDITEQIPHTHTHTHTDIAFNIFCYFIASPLILLTGPFSE